MRNRIRATGLLEIKREIALLSKSVIFAALLTAAGFTGWAAPTLAQDAKVSAAAEKLPADIKASGKLVLGTSAAVGLPWSSIKEGTADEFIGFDHDLTEAIAKKLGLTLEVSNMGFDALIPSLDAKRVDIVVSGMFDTLERQKKVDFIDYAIGGSIMLQRAAMENGPAERDQLCGFKVAALRGSLEAANAGDISDKCQAAGKKPLDLKIFPDAGAALPALLSGQVDVMVGDLEYLALMASEHPDQFKTAGETFNAGVAGMSVHKGSSLGPAVLDVLNELMQDGTYDKIFTQYHMPESARLTKATFNTATVEK